MVFGLWSAWDVGNVLMDGGYGRKLEGMFPRDNPLDSSATVLLWLAILSLPILIGLLSCLIPQLHRHPAIPRNSIMSILVLWMCFQGLIAFSIGGVALITTLLQPLPLTCLAGYLLCNVPVLKNRAAN